MRYSIEKDKIYKQWVLWRQTGSLKVEIEKNKYIKPLKERMKELCTKQKKCTNKTN